MSAPDYQKKGQVYHVSKAIGLIIFDYLDLIKKLFFKKSKHKNRKTKFYRVI